MIWNRFGRYIGKCFGKIALYQNLYNLLANILADLRGCTVVNVFTSYNKTSF
jgi:hypothetical protein